MIKPISVDQARACALAIAKHFGVNLRIEPDPGRGFRRSIAFENEDGSVTLFIPPVVELDSIAREVTLHIRFDEQPSLARTPSGGWRSFRTFHNLLRKQGYEIACSVLARQRVELALTQKGGRA